MTFSREDGDLKITPFRAEVLDGYGSSGSLGRFRGFYPLPMVVVY